MKKPNQRRKSNAPPFNGRFGTAVPDLPCPMTPPPGSRARWLDVVAAKLNVDVWEKARLT